MRSAYKTKLGFEPEFTNYAKVMNDEPFIDTLDYIFLSPQWSVNNVLPLPSKEASMAIGPLPTQHEPSDHLMIAADLSI